MSMPAGSRLWSAAGIMIFLSNSCVLQVWSKTAARLVKAQDMLSASPTFSCTQNIFTAQLSEEDMSRQLALVLKLVHGLG